MKARTARTRNYIDYDQSVGTFAVEGPITSTTTVTGATGVVATTGNVAATAGAVSAGTTVTAGTGLIATTGGVTANGTFGESTALKIATYTVNAATATGTGTGTLTIANMIPAKSVVLGVTAFVDTILAGSGLTTWELGVTSDTDRYGTTLAIAANTAVNSLTSGATGYTAPHVQYAAINGLMTAAAGVFSTGIVHIAVHYFTITDPTT